MTSPAQAGSGAGAAGAGAAHVQLTFTAEEFKIVMCCMAIGLASLAYDMKGAVIGLDALRELKGTLGVRRGLMDRLVLIAEEVE